MGKQGNRRAKPRPLILKVVEELIAERRRLYEEQGDPLRVWEAYRAARQYQEWGIKVPAWVLEYFDRVALKLVTIGVEQPAGDALSSLVMSALEITRPGRGTIFTRRNDADRDDELAREVAHLVAGATKAYMAVDEVAQLHGVSPSTVDRAWVAAKARKRLIPDLVVSLQRDQFPDGVLRGTVIESHEGRRARRFIVQRTIEEDDQIIRVAVSRA